MTSTAGFMQPGQQQQQSTSQLPSSTNPTTTPTPQVVTSTLPSGSAINNQQPSSALTPTSTAVAPQQQQPPQTLIVQQGPQPVYTLSGQPAMNPNMMPMMSSGQTASTGVVDPTTGLVQPQQQQQQMKPPILTMNASSQQQQQQQQQPQPGYMMYQQSPQQQQQQMLMMPHQQYQHQQHSMMIATPGGAVYSTPSANAQPTPGQPQPPMLYNNNNPSMMQQQQQQQQIMPPPQPLATDTTTSTSTSTTPTKKLTKKQLRELQQQQLDNSVTGEGSDTNIATPTKGGKGRKLKPKQQKISALSGGTGDDSTNGNDLDEDGAPADDENSNTEEGGGLSASTHANIEATIDDLMKQYIDSPTNQNDANNDEADDSAKKKKKKKKAGGKKKTDVNPDNDNENDETAEHDESFNEITTATRKTARRSVKKNLRDADSNDEFEVQPDDLNNDSIDKAVKKQSRGKPGKKKTGELGSEETAAVSGEATVDDLATPKPILAPKAELGERFKAVMSMPTMPSNRGRRKSTQGLLKMMKKKQKKKKGGAGGGGGGSSGDERNDNSDNTDDSDDFELTNATAISMNKGKAAAAAAAAAAVVDEASAQDGGGADDEETAKSLQASENKRRSARAATTKKQEKYADTMTLRDEDLLMPVDPNAAEDEELPPNDSNIMLQSQENLIVDKILGMQIFTDLKYFGGRFTVFFFLILLNMSVTLMNSNKSKKSSKILYNKRFLILIYFKGNTIKTALK
jgi:hypothetical protein